MHGNPTSTKESAGRTTDSEANKELVRAFVAAWNDRDFAAFDRLMADDAVLTVGGSTISCNAAATRAIAQAWTTAFPGLAV